MTNFNQDVTMKSLFKFHNKLGFWKILRGVEYFRYFEWIFALHQINFHENSKILDLGSGAESILPNFISNMGGLVCAVDLNTEIKNQKQISNKLHFSNQRNSAGKLWLNQQDATKLAFKNNSFDYITAISVLEHFAKDGDIQAMNEIYRVLVPGGKLIITLPYNRNSFEEFDKTRLVNYFERVYDEAALVSRITDNSRFNLLKKVYFGEIPFSFFNWWLKIPGHLRILIGWLLLLAASFFIRETEPEKACGVAIILEKVMNE
ncbi:MAG: hypothetical protein A2161_08685 [Candidatus Schekmanbacteria bacterium RBG_13_48_7]|uniref:Methyltransferase type 11 domain-containing protein n=1 Tax=Candidatus Schekmanbacteria bacterium RBG_13_48_7 TaxID=1817878 RepID=A0A1F7RNP7_9BACT|nr:MAG: hypothetical protein A2161_08685 [Candidatus Schekmanbacteria bacterium RBG_13_48_7]